MFKVQTGLAVTFKVKKNSSFYMHGAITLSTYVSYDTPIQILEPWTMSLYCNPNETTAKIDHGIPTHKIDRPWKIKNGGSLSNAMHNWAPTSGFIESSVAVPSTHLGYNPMFDTLCF